MYRDSLLDQYHNDSAASDSESRSSDPDRLIDDLLDQYPPGMPVRVFVDYIDLSAPNICDHLQKNVSGLKILARERDKKYDDSLEIIINGKDKIESLMKFDNFKYGNSKLQITPEKYRKAIDHLHPLQSQWIKDNKSKTIQTKSKEIIERKQPQQKDSKEDKQPAPKQVKECKVGTKEQKQTKVTQLKRSEPQPIAEKSQSKTRQETYQPVWIKLTGPSIQKYSRADLLKLIQKQRSITQDQIRGIKKLVSAKKQLKGLRVECMSSRATDSLLSWSKGPFKFQKYIQGIY